MTRLLRSARRRDRLALLWSLVGLCTAGCPASPPVERGAARPSPVRVSSPQPTALSAHGETGAIDQAGADARWAEVIHRVQGCLQARRTGLPFLGGDLDLQVEIGPGGSAERVTLRSTVGDHEVDACARNAAAGAAWPRPVGGARGHTGKSFGFESGDIRLRIVEAPALARAMKAGVTDGSDPFAQLVAALRGCRDELGLGPMTVTLYVDEDGFCQSHGVSVNAADVAPAVACVATVVQTTSFPASEAGPFKVHIEVP